MLFPAWGAEVVSSNIVGYNKVNLVKGFTQIGVQFQNVGTDDQSIGLNDLQFTGLVGFDWDEFVAGDTLTIWDPTTQTYANTYSWSGVRSEDYDVPANVWFDEAELAEADVPLSAGDSVFVNSSSQETPTATVAGEVMSDAAVTIQLSKGFTQFANPYPVAVKINDISFSGLTGFDWSEFVATDTLTIWDPSTQTYPNTYSWSGEGSEDYDVPANVWFDEAELAEADVTIPVGGTVFINSANGGSAVFAKP